MSRWPEKLLNAQPQTMSDKNLPDLNPKKDETLKGFLDRVIPGITKTVVDAAEEMDKNGEEWSMGSVGKLFNKTAGSFKNVLKGGNKNKEQKSLGDGNEASND